MADMGRIQAPIRPLASAAPDEARLPLDFQLVAPLPDAYPLAPAEPPVRLALDSTLAEVIGGLGQTGRTPTLHLAPLTPADALAEAMAALLFDQLSDRGALALMIEPVGAGFRLRARMPGGLRELCMLDDALGNALASLLKRAAAMSATASAPQQAAVRLGGLSGRAATMPCRNGEHLTITFARADPPVRALRALGMTAAAAAGAGAIVHRAGTLTLVAGARGSGRSTTRPRSRSRQTHPFAASRSSGWGSARRGGR